MTPQQAFGDRLRRHRDHRGIELKAVADQTKIGSSMLAALERGDCSRWPTGIYSRAWVREYAQAVGLDGDEIVAEFTSCFGRTAFPDGPPPDPPATTPEPAATATAAPLRLTLAEAENGRLRQYGPRAVLLLVDVVLALAAAAALAAAVGTDFPVAIAASSVGCHGLGLLGGGGSAFRCLARGSLTLAALAGRTLSQTGPRGETSAGIEAVEQMTDDPLARARRAA